MNKQQEDFANDRRWPSRVFASLRTMRGLRERMNRPPRHRLMCPARAALGAGDCFQAATPPVWQRNTHVRRARSRSGVGAERVENVHCRCPKDKREAVLSAVPSSWPPFAFSIWESFAGGVPRLRVSKAPLLRAAGGPRERCRGIHPSPMPAVAHRAAGHSSGHHAAPCVDEARFVR